MAYFKVYVSYIYDSAKIAASPWRMHACMHASTALERLPFDAVHCVPPLGLTNSGTPPHIHVAN